ncbi:hypothetical protein [Paenibacillus sp. YYML68]|uniref:hypothetical protein n=1 Tax=Paenibacillus sp. YYML68 TaxID=2909250 RepID=UPI00249274F4|nr:hypothetical protein [Paenibacillus sp. YYML68]
MPMEAEVSIYLILGFSAVIITVLAFVVGWWIRYKNQAYGWLTLHLLLFIASVSRWLKAIQVRPDEPMASELNSIVIAQAGGLWALSMLFFMFGLYKLKNTTKN